MSNALQIKLEGAFDDRLDCLVRLADRLGPLFDGTDYESCTLEFEGCRSFGAAAATMIHAALRSALKPVEYRFPQDLHMTAVIAQYLGAIYTLGELPWGERVRLQQEVVPVETFLQVHTRLADPIVKLIASHTTLSADAEDYLRLGLGEVAQNVLDHAMSAFGGIWCARYAPDKGQVHVSTTDCGLGIQRTLCRQYPDLTTSAAAILRALEGNVSSRSGKHNMGLGLSNLAGFVRQCQGRLLILSGDAACELVWDREELRMADGCPPWQGTVVAFVLSTNPPRD